MELGLILAVACSIATNFYLVSKIKQPVVNVYERELPAPVVHVNMPFVPELTEIVSAPGIDYERLELMVASVVAALQHPPVYPIPMPQYPVPGQMPYIISETDNKIDIKTDNTVEIDGVRGKQFPMR